jgi:hypothetical protein
MGVMRRWLGCHPTPLVIPSRPIPPVPPGDVTWSRPTPGSDQPSGFRYVSAHLLRCTHLNRLPPHIVAHRCGWRLERPLGPAGVYGGHGSRSGAVHSQGKVSGHSVLSNAMCKMCSGPCFVTPTTVPPGQVFGVNPSFLCDVLQVSVRRNPALAVRDQRGHSGEDSGGGASCSWDPVIERGRCGRHSHTAPECAIGCEAGRCPSSGASGVRRWRASNQAASYGADELPTWPFIAPRPPPHPTSPPPPHPNAAPARPRPPPWQELP